MNAIVQKFGGTSLGQANRITQVASIVKEYIPQNQVLVVLSAFSSLKKTDGTTARLLEAASESIKGGTYYKIVDHIEQYHLDIIKQSIKDISTRESIKEEIIDDLNHLKSFLDAIQIIGELSAKSFDNIISIGEKLSAKIFSALLNSIGIDSEYVDLSNIIEGNFDEVNQSLIKHFNARLKEKLKEINNKVPVFTGFFGPLDRGILDTLGRGYTDFTAAMVAVSVKAKELQIWKEVDGIFTSDPKKVSSARVLETIAPEEAAELTYYGSEVIHPSTMEHVIRSKIPIHIKNTFFPKNKGTLIDPNYQKKGKGPVAVTAKKNITIINVNSNRMLMAYGFMSKLFGIFKKYRIIIDLIATTEVNVSITVEAKKIPPAMLEELKEIGQVALEPNMAIVSLVGLGLKKRVGIAGKMFSKLAKANINIETISQGSSEINISCVIAAKDADKAIQILHNELIENDNKTRTD